MVLPERFLNCGLQDLKPVKPAWKVVVRSPPSQNGFVIFKPFHAYC